jgi:hypothetical protein
MAIALDDLFATSHHTTFVGADRAESVNLTSDGLSYHQFGSFNLKVSASADGNVREGSNFKTSCKAATRTSATSWSAPSHDRGYTGSANDAEANCFTTRKCGIEITGSHYDSIPGTRTMPSWATEARSTPSRE